ncbi:MULTISPECIES: hypothetical protein [unclassified Pseudoalteromonas]|jgi:hypothetical protein|uniref:hypothetical protein n=1 Tax=unclassified Pseudoalteromonas TaxID=194690 RepID=UPI00257325F4|nr:hypothetical protein [Pseudoalteromonas sp. MM1]BED90812.1 hypothetical protein PspMM1_32800 [Pseudoalteromonas sp. MM1]
MGIQLWFVYQLKQIKNELIYKHVVVFLNMPKDLRKNLIAAILSPLIVLPVLGFCYLYAGIENYTSVSSLISGVGFGISIGMGSLFYFYPLMFIYGLPISLLLQKLNLFKLPVVLILSILPVFLLSLFSEFNRETLVVHLLVLSIGLTSWLIYNKLK